MLRIGNFYAGAQDLVLQQVRTDTWNLHRRSTVAIFFPWVVVDYGVVGGAWQYALAVAVAAYAVAVACRTIQWTLTVIQSPALNHFRIMQTGRRGYILLRYTWR